jgi:signal transduction histidine kinase
MGIHHNMSNEITAANQPQRPTLLIVDDEPGPRESLRIVFKDRYQCAVATCGQAGIDYARQHHVDAAILDIKMPDLSGVDVLREIKEIDPDIECVMLTGYETIETARAAVRYGAADYLNKPFDVFHVRELLAKCMTRRQGKQQSVVEFQSLQQLNDQLSRELTETTRAVTASILSAGVVHEMNNPLAIIAGYAELLKRDLAAIAKLDHATADHVHRRLASIQHEIDRCKNIAHRFLAFSRATMQPAQTVPISQLLDDAIALIKAHPSNRSAEFSTRVTELGLQLTCQPAEILQILINLGVNALQAMDGRGTLALTAETVAAAPATCAFRSAGFQPAQPFVCIGATDTGNGILPDDLKKVFDPYFTTKTEGTGIGLAIVCKLVSQYNGGIDIQSSIGHGTTFNLYLPSTSAPC